MHRALLLPEIVAEIIQAGSSSPGFLYTCLLISKSFSLETCRILWYICGADGSGWCEHAIPNIRDLARIVNQDARRAQYYANFIHVLCFAQKEEEVPPEFEGPEYIDEEAGWHKQLVSLQYPQLEDVSIHKTEHGTALNTGDVIAHYAQPNIETFTVYQGSGLSDSFFDKLVQSCPRLQSFHLSGISDSRVSKDGLVRFLTKFDALTALVLRTGTYNSWSYEAFKAMAKLSNLTYVTFPDIQDNWVNAIFHENSSTSIFPEVTFLETGMSDHDLECFAPHVPNLDSLVLSLQDLPPSHSILASASHFSQLTQLEVRFGPRNWVSGNDLLLLAQNCSLLERLYVGEVNDSEIYSEIYPFGSAYHPSGRDIDDDTIEKVAQAFGTRLTSLRIIFDRPDMLTWRSVLSFAQYCKNLLGLIISCNFNWQEVMSGTLEHTFPALETLDFIFDKSIRESQPAPDYNDQNKEMVQKCAQRMFEFAPALTSFWIEGGSGGDDRWENTVSNICYSRWTPMDEIAEE